MAFGQNSAKPTRNDLVQPGQGISGRAAASSATASKAVATAGGLLLPGAAIDGGGVASALTYGQGTLDRDTLVQPGQAIDGRAVPGVLYYVTDGAAVAGVAGLMQFHGDNLPANYTGYLTSRGVKTAIGQGRVVVDGGVCGSLYVEATSAPGDGESYVYTVLKNGLATGITVTISGDSETVDSIETDVSFDAEDTLAVRVVTSSGAAQCDHNATAKYTPT